MSPSSDGPARQIADEAERSRLAAAPEDLPALFRLYAAQRNFAPLYAVRVLRRALTLFPSHHGAVGEWSAIISDENGDETILKWRRRSARLAPHEPNAWRLLAEAAIQNGNLPLAEQARKFCLTLKPQSWNDWLGLAHVYVAAACGRLSVAYMRAGRAHPEAALPAEITAFAAAAAQQIRYQAERDRLPNVPAARAVAVAPPTPSPRRAFWAVVPGAVRDLAQLNRILDRLIAYRSEGLLDGVVLSTWNGQLDGEELYGLRRRLRSDNIGVAQAAPPDLQSKGHILHQMSAVRNGCMACPDDTFILKLRTDKIDDRLLANLRPLLDGGVRMTQPDTVGAAVFGANLKYRLVCADGMLHRLFNHADQVFLGHRDDVCALTVYENAFGGDEWPRRAEQCWFSRPFVEATPLFKDYFKYSPYPQNDGMAARNLLAQWLDNEFFLICFVNYLLILKFFFRIGFHRDDDPVIDDSMSELKNLTCEEWFFHAPPSLGRIALHGLAPTPIFTDDRWVGPMIDGKLRPSRLGRRLAEALAETADPARRIARLADPTLSALQREQFAAMTDPWRSGVVV